MYFVIFTSSQMLTSSSNTVLVEMHTDQSVVDQGFKLSYAQDGKLLWHGNGVANLLENVILKTLSFNSPLRGKIPKML